MFKLAIIIFLTLIMASLVVTTFNVDGIQGATKRHKLFTKLLNFPNSIFCLQETHYCATTNAKRWEQEWPGKSF